MLEGNEHVLMMHIPPRVGEEERARWVVEEDRGKQELRVYPQPLHIVPQVRGGPEVVTLSTYLEHRVGQHVHLPNLLRPETLPKKLPTRRLQAITGKVPVRETILRGYRHRGLDLPEEYMQFHCGKELETYEHFMQCEQYWEIDSLMVMDQDILLLRRGEKVDLTWSGSSGEKGIAKVCSKREW